MLCLRWVRYLRYFKKYSCIIVMFLIVASCVAFGRIAGNDFINYDDKGYITENNHIKSAINAESIKWAFTAEVEANWHPLTMLSHMLDWNMFGENASGHHLVSLLIHIGAVIFLFLFLNKTTNNIWPSAFAVAFFAFHPLRVESVGWAAERKDVLSIFFGMASIYTYAFYAQNSKISRYLLCLILFSMSLMCKPMLVTLPFVLLLLDYWPLGRWQKVLSSPAENRQYSAGRLIYEKAPLFFLTIASSIITLWAQNKGEATFFGENLSFVTRTANAIISYVAYLKQIFWPQNLAVFYPYEVIIPLWKVIISIIILILITVVVLYYIKRLPFLFVGWFWYLGTLIPVIGLIQVGRQGMADRYTYLPSIGIAVGMAWLIQYLIKNEKIRKRILFPAGLAVLLLLVVLTWKQCGYWKNSFTLFNHTIRITKDNYQAYDLLASALFDKGRIEESIVHYNEAIRLKPDYHTAYCNRGVAHFKLEQYQKATEDFSKAIILKNDYAHAYYSRGVVYTLLAQYQRAIEDYNKAISLKYDDARVYHDRGVAYLLLGNKKLGCIDVEKACAMGSCGTYKKAKDNGDCR